jgi:hypothetical protein
MDDRLFRAVGREPAWLVGGAIRDELLGREVLDVDVACADPERAARAYGREARGAVFPLSERHGAWRVALRSGRTVDFTPLVGGSIDADLATRDFTVNAMARLLLSRELVDPFGGQTDVEQRRLRAVSAGIFEDDPLRLLRAVRLEQEIGFRLDEETERLLRESADLVTRSAGERILGELERLPPAGYARLDELGLLGRLGGVAPSGAVPVDSAAFRLVWFFRDGLERLPISNEVRRYTRTLLRARAPADASAREIHRFRCATEPWALDALALLGGDEKLVEAVVDARAREPSEPLLRGDELGVPPGPEVGRLLALVAEERAAGTITTREEALQLVEREKRVNSST